VLIYRLIDRLNRVDMAAGKFQARGPATANAQVTDGASSRGWNDNMNADRGRLHELALEMGGTSSSSSSSSVY